MTDIKDYVTKAHEFRVGARGEIDPLRRAILEWADNGLMQIARQTSAYGDIHLSEAAAKRPQMKGQNVL